MSAKAHEYRAVPSRPLLTLCRYCVPYWKSYAAALLVGFVFLAASQAMPLVLSMIIEDFEAREITTGLLWGYFYFLVLIAAITAICRFFQRLLIGRAARRFEYTLRNDYFRHIQGLSQEFFNRTKTGDIMARATNDLNFVRDFVGAGIMGIIDLFRIPFAVAVLMHFSIQLSVAVVVAVPFASVPTYYILKWTRRQARVVQELFSGITALAQENLAGARVVRAYDISDRQVEAFGGESKIYARENLKLVAIRAAIGPMMAMVLRAIMVITLWKGALMVINGETTSQIVIANGWLAVETSAFTLADLMGFIVCLLMVSGSLAGFAGIAVVYQQAAAGMERISQFMAETPSVDDSDDTDTTITSLHGGIEFRGVSFVYDSQPVLRDISWKCEPGETVAIVGHTGSGKSTMMSLMTRMCDPVDGVVLMDGVDARHVPLSALRASIGLVPQDTFLFSDTIRGNLTVGRPGATEDEIMEACRIAQFDEALAGMDDGLDTVLGERGINLSGGQKQRVTIARALIKDSAILLLDDALSSVDTHTEEQILQGLKSVMATRTCVIISHRVSTVRHADLILVLDEGEIRERGVHNDLLAQNGLYTKMYEHQLLEDELEEE
jgi:ATP-binding cassette subfamily B protein